MAVDINSYYISAINGTEMPEPSCFTGNNNASAGEWYSYTATFDTDHPR